MKIEMWLDYLCPLTYKVHQHLIETIETHPESKIFEVLYRSFEMMPKQQMIGMPLVAYLALHHMMTEEEVLSYCHCIGVPIDHLTVVDVKKAHQIAHLAKHKNIARQMNERLFEAYFEHGMDIGNEEVLIEIGIEAGLDELEIKDVFDTEKYIEAIDLNRENAMLKGIQNVPHIRIEGKHKLEGYIQVFDIKQAISKAKHPEHVKKEHGEGENGERKKTR
jgi:predicted DsbA family dithiol-disulfide isomerase